MHKNLVVAGALLSVVAGCASPDAGLSQPEGLGVASQALDLADIQVATSDSGATLTYGHCNNDGYVIKNGDILRLGVAVGSDATGITSQGSSACHNTGVWSQGVTYVCNSNQGTDPAGTYSGDVPEFDEWSGYAYVQFPASVATAGLNFGHASLSLCDTPSHADYALISIECCAAPATQ